MDVLDVDPELLRRSADAALHAAEQTQIHIDAEIAGRIPELMETLVPEGPYAYTIQPQFNPDLTVRAPILTTRDEIRAAYEQVRGASDLLSAEPMVEIRGTWYTFQEAVSTGQLKGTDEPSNGVETLAIFPVSTGAGITGELVWPRLPVDFLGQADAPADAPTEPREQRRATLVLHDRYLDSLRATDVEAMLATFNDVAQSAIRDYANDTGTLTELQDADAHREHYRVLFDRYEIVAVEMLDRVVQDWYVFAELRFTVRPRGDATAPTSSFHVAEYLVLGRDRRFIVRIGHGTDPA
jgi:hypothetical protein